MSLSTPTSWTDRFADIFAGLAMSSPVDDLQCLAWEPHPDADGLFSEDAAKLAWQARLQGVGIGGDR